MGQRNENIISKYFLYTFVFIYVFLLVYVLIGSMLGDFNYLLKTESKYGILIQLIYSIMVSFVIIEII